MGYRPIICTGMRRQYVLAFWTCYGRILWLVRKTDRLVFVQVYGSCVDNAVMDRRPSYLCQADGNWYSHAGGGCLCVPGYQPIHDLQRCVGLYMWQNVVFLNKSSTSNYSAPDGGAECCDERVCLCVRVFVLPRSYLRNYVSDLHQIFFMLAYWKVMYSRFYGRRHICS